MSHAQPLAGLRFLMFVGDDYEDLELWYPYYRLREAGADVADIGCGSGQLLYFLRGEGYTDLLGIDLDPKFGLSRSKRRLSESGSDESRFENLDLAFHQRVRAGFIAEAKASGRKHVVIDATRPVEDMAGEIAGLVDAVIGS